MAPFGTLYTSHGNPRAIPILAVAKANNIELTQVEIDLFGKGVSAEFKAKFPMGKVPAFEDPSGFKLHESLAITLYLARQNPHNGLLGKDEKEYASIIQWLSFANSEVFANLFNWLLPIFGFCPYNQTAVNDAEQATRLRLNYLNQVLETRTFLVGERLSLADIVIAAYISRGFQYLFDPEFRAPFGNVTRYFCTVQKQPIYAAVTNEFPFLDCKAQPPAPPKKEEKPKATDNKNGVDEDGIPKEPKVKHSLEALPPPKTAMDEWKRTYSNKDSPEALSWFWQHIDLSSDYSLWRVDYKYNKELELTFQSSNLCGGFFQRLEASRKYIFGCLCVYGVNNDSVISGAFLVRGQDAQPAFDVAPDYDSYTFTKLNPSKPADKTFVESAWSWDKPVTIDGKSYGFADGKVFK